MSDPTTKLELPQDIINDLASLAYRKWSSAYDDLKSVRSEKDDGTLDWKLFHAERLKNNLASERAARRVLDAIAKFAKF